MIDNIDTKNKNPAKCFMNLTYKQTPNPNSRYSGSGAVVLQQQNRPGLKLQQYY
jgi:hypothetical protein